MIENLTIDKDVTTGNYKAVAKDIKAIEDLLNNQAIFNLENKNKDHGTKLENTKKAVEKMEAKAALEAKIAEAEQLVKDTKKSATDDGKDIVPAEKWAKQADITTMNAAITTAKGELSKGTQDLKNAKTTLESAMTTFVGQRTAGNKPA